MNFQPPRTDTSGDLLADRRFGWGDAEARDGNNAAAADLFCQTLELVPDWAPCWLALGVARQKMGDLMGAHEAFLRADALDRTGELGASLRLSTLGGPAPATAPPAYVRALFDQYAAGFDDHLVAGLTYRGPERLIAAMECACATLDRAFEFNRAIDLGCGTGLMAAALKDHVRSIIGVDLSPRMIEVAKAAGFYDQLRIDDLEPFLATQPAASSDLMIAADVFVYVGDLDGIFAQCARVIEPGGVFAFTVQRADGAGWALGHDMRFFHSEDYLRTLAASHGFSTVEMEDLSSRKDAGVDVPGLVAVLARS